VMGLIQLLQTIIDDMGGNLGRGDVRLSHHHLDLS
jgi:hypothetical protein